MVIFIIKFSPCNHFFLNSYLTRYFAYCTIIVLIIILGLFDNNVKNVSTNMDIRYYTRDIRP